MPVFYIYSLKTKNARPTPCKFKENMYIILVWSFINIIFSVFFLSQQKLLILFFFCIFLYIHISMISRMAIVHTIYIYILCSLSYSSLLLFSDIKPYFLYTGSFLFSLSCIVQNRYLDKNLEEIC